MVERIEQGEPTPTVEHLRALKRRVVSVGIPTPRGVTAAESGGHVPATPEAVATTLIDASRAMRPALITLNNLARQIESFCDRHGATAFTPDEKEPLRQAWRRLGLLFDPPPDDA
jgi:hypothetical protein